MIAVSETKHRACRRTLQGRKGLSLLELMAAVTIIGVLAYMVVPRLGEGSSQAKQGACHVNREVINVQTALWRRENGSWPATNLVTIGSDTSYFPEGLPTCPVDGTAYTIDTTDGKVVGHEH